jgi:hypothetical protein
MQFMQLRYSRGINGLTILNRTYRSSAPNVHHNEARLLDWFVYELCHRPQNKRVADSMESILAQAVRLGDFLVDRVCAHGFRDCVVEGGVEEGDALYVWKLGFAMADDFQCGKIVTFRTL